MSSAVGSWQSGQRGRGVESWQFDSWQLAVGFGSCVGHCYKSHPFGRVLRPSEKYATLDPSTIQFLTMKKESKSPLPISLKSIKIENFAGILRTELNDLPGDAQWIFLTGENGFGKTSVLRGVAAGVLSGEVFHLITNKASINLQIARFNSLISSETEFERLNLLRR